jgi:hypothetical protein
MFVGTKVLNPMNSLVKNIKRIKILVTVWERNKRVDGKKELERLESELDKLYSDFLEGLWRKRINYW